MIISESGSRHRSEEESSDSISLDLITKMPLFGKATKSPVELVRVLKESLLVLEKGGDGKKQEKAQEDVSKHLTSITVILSGSDSEQQSDILLAQLSQEMYNSGLLPLLLKNMHRIDFEV